MLPIADRLEWLVSGSRKLAADDENWVVSGKAAFRTKNRKNDANQRLRYALTFSHVIHGLLFYFFAHLLWRHWHLFGGRPAAWALPIAVAFEGFWELLENSPLIIDRYRAVTVSFGYEGDSVLNSMSDIGFMALGFWIASKLPWKASVALAIAFELFTLFMIRDNLTLNVLMLVWPLEAVRQWQGGV